jgi:hypothetical protein
MTLAESVWAKRDLPGRDFERGRGAQLTTLPLHRVPAMSAEQRAAAERVSGPLRDLEVPFYECC